MPSFTDALAAAHNEAPKEAPPAAAETIPDPDQCIPTSGRTNALRTAENAFADPRTGELLNVETATERDLVDVILECRRRQALEDTWRKSCEGELRKRMGDKRVMVVDRHELKFTTGRAKDWDYKALRACLRALTAAGELPAGVLPEGLFTTPSVNGTAANRLLDRVEGEVREQIAECFRWVDKGRPKLTIGDVPDLADALPE